MSNENTIKRLANDCVRYIITQKSTNDEITASELLEKAVKDKSIRFSIVFKKVQTILLHVYGLKLVKKTATTQKYVLINVLPYIPEISVENHKSATNLENNVLFLVLTHIFMSKGEATFDSIKKFLDKLGLDSQRNDLRLNLKPFLLNNFVKRNYLVYDSSTDIFRWGLLATDNINMMQILKIAVEMSNLPSVKSFESQYEMAVNQQFAEQSLMESDSSGNESN